MHVFKPYDFEEICGCNKNIKKYFIIYGNHKSQIQKSSYLESKEKEYVLGT